jgi:L-alanine-DL-glutamate epimerase-like enolase superfamily enzyme
LAALDMARWQVYLKQSNQTIAVAIGIENVVKEVPHTFTLGVSGESEMKEKISFAQNLDFNLFKLKLNGINDQEVLSTFRSLSSAPFAVDANQAWTSIDQCLACLDFLETEQCVLIEQPFNKLDRRLTHELKSRTDIPVIADEACQQITDLEDVLQVFDGVNVKLQKCGGITPALAQLKAIRAADKKALIGCMSESSIGCNAAENLTLLCHWADLDGPYLNANNVELCKKLGYSL